MEEFRTTLRKNPEAKANIISRIFFCFINPFLRFGYKNNIDTEDLHECLPDDESQALSDEVEKMWTAETLDAKEKGRDPSFFRVLRKKFGLRFMLLGLCLLAESLIQILQPVFMGGLIRYFQYGSTMETRTAYLYAFGVAACAAIFSTIHHPYFYSIQRIGLKMKITASALIFRKHILLIIQIGSVGFNITHLHLSVHYIAKVAVRLSSNAMHKVTVGHIVNLLSNDVARFDFFVIFLHHIWVSPIAVLGFLYLLWQHMGPSCLAGFAMIFLLIPIQGVFSRLMGKYRGQIAVKADKRVGIMGQILNGIRVIKMYAWEAPFSKLIYDARQAEIGMVRRGAMSQAMVMALFFATYHLVVLCALAAYLLSGHSMNAEHVFVAAALFNSARLSLTLFLPFAIMHIFETKVTLKRIQDFLVLEENVNCSLMLNGSCVKNGKTAEGKKGESEGNKAQEPMVELVNYSAKWEEDQKQPTLADISLKATPRKLIMIIGPVGAGKSSILSSILGEMLTVSGESRLNGKMAYVPQEAWVFSASFRQNILFGHDYDSANYQKSIRVCALRKDLALLPNGDNSLVGDRGVSLSGGQKARINLARAVYRDADIYLLDDPLSAVDASVSRFLFEKCIQGHLKEKVRILVTHQLQYLKYADHIVVMKEGRIAAEGTLEDLERLGDQFSAIIQETQASYERMDSVSSPPPSHRGRISSRVSEKDGTEVEIRTRNKRKLSSSEDTETLLSSTAKEELDLSAEAKSLSDSAWSLALGTEKPAALEEEEDRQVGSVRMSVYYRFLSKGGPHPIFILPLIVFTVFVQFVYNLCDWWLKVWANQAEYKAFLERNGSALNSTASNLEQSVHSWELSPENYLHIYLGLIFFLLITSIIRTCWFRYTLTVASHKLHNGMFRGIINTPVSFFDRNPVGRILNRFSKDVGVMDEQLGFSFFDFIQGMLNFLSVLIVVGILNPLVFIPTVPLSAVFVFIRHYYLRTSRQIKRIEATTRSPVFSHISASLNGLTTIRAFGAEPAVLLNFYQYTDTHTAAFAMFLTTTRWFAVVIDWLSACYVACVAFLCVAGSSEGTSGEVGLALFYSIGLLGLLSHYMNQWAQLSNTMVSVERILNYSELKPEPQIESPPDKKPAKSWPAKGEIELKDLSLRYDTSGSYVLNKINCKISAAEKIGIVGRTGAGKSSLLGALFRLYPIEGSVIIDELDTSAVGLEDLRRRISIIPQDPVLFIGSLRENLDPFDEYTDDQLWTALEQVQLKTMITGLSDGLETPMQEGGANLSVGQRQLVCLARALLKNARILVIDEATANVDLHTDVLIQEKIRSCFVNSTVITIAHRLNTIMDSDRVMVLSEGHLEEMDAPHNLLKNNDSVFTQLVNETGPSTAQTLKKLAEASFQNKKTD